MESMDKDFRMVGGEEKASYAKNSFLQRLTLWEMKHILEKSIEELLRSIDLPASCIKVADLGCSSGPNAFLTLEHIVESVDKAAAGQIRNGQEPPAIQYFLSDFVSNDSNLVFKGLPEFYEKLEKEYGRRYGSCLIAAMPGSFYGKLFPDSSMHFFHSSDSLHWLSQVPRGLVTESGIPMNKGSIYCGKKSPPIVRKLYLDQFTQDFSMFLRVRSQEIVQHGQLLLSLLCENSEEDDGSKINYFDLMGMTLTDMVTEGYIEEKKLDSFSFPMYKPRVDEAKQVIEDEGSLKIWSIQTFTTPLNVISESTADPFDKAMKATTVIRSVFQPVLASHFGEAIMDDFFRRLARKFVSCKLTGEGVHNTLVICLTRNE